jgi:hypothetical protein
MTINKEPYVLKYDYNTFKLIDPITEKKYLLQIFFDESNKKYYIDLK